MLANAPGAQGRAVMPNPAYKIPNAIQVLSSAAAMLATKACTRFGDCAAIGFVVRAFLCADALQRRVNAAMLGRCAPLGWVAPKLLAGVGLF